MLGIDARARYLDKMESVCRTRAQRLRIEAYVASLVATGDETLDSEQAFDEILTALDRGKLEVVGDNRATWQIIDRQFDRLYREHKALPPHSTKDRRKQMLDKAEAFHQEADRLSALANSYQKAISPPWMIVDR